MTSLFTGDPARAVCFGGPEPCTLGELARHAGGVARLLAPGRPVVLACTDRYAFTVGLAAAWARGAVVHLPPPGRNASVEAVASAAGDAPVLHDRRGRAGIHVPDVARAEPVAEPDFDWNALAAVLYSSGTSGVPQAHTKSLGQLLGETAMLVERFSLAEHRVACLVPCAHVYGLLYGVLIPLVGRGALMVTSALLPADVFAMLAETHPQVLVASPPHLTAIASTQPSALSSLRVVFSSGAPLPDDVLAALVIGGARVIQVFGSTETGGIACRQDLEQRWTPLPGVRITVADDDRLAVDSPWLSPDEPRPRITEDRVVLETGGFRHLGRADTIVKVGGRRVDLSEIEAHLRAVPGVTAATVVARPTAGVLGTEILAAVQAPDGGVTRDDLRRDLARTLDILPWRFRIVPHLPETAAGKRERQALLALFDEAT